MDFKIRKIKFEDYEQVEKIYFEGENPENADSEAFLMPWDVWIRERVPGCTIVAFKDNVVLGWAALTPLSNKNAAVGVNDDDQEVRVAEEGVYVAEKYRRQGIGQALLKKIIELSKKNGIWTLKARILPTNTTSIALHKKFGFKEVDSDGSRVKMDEQWKDVILMERNAKNDDFQDR